MLIGIVGKANVGKSTFFKAITLADTEIANFPFATIKPHHGIGYVKISCVDKDFGKQCKPREGYCKNGFRFVPVELLDVAGLVPGAHQGKGMGNQFLDDLRQADVLIHVIDAAGTTNEMGEPREPGSYDPANDIKFLETELDMWYLQILRKSWEKFARMAHMEHVPAHRAIARQFGGLKVSEDMVRSIIAKLQLDPENADTWTEVQLAGFAVALRKASKPMIIAANKADIPIARENVEKLKKQFPEYTIIACSADSELALKEAAKAKLIDYTPGENSFTIIEEQKLKDVQKKALEFIKISVLNNLGSTGCQQVLDYSVFNILGYITIFPGGVNKLEDQHGNPLPDCFLMPPKSTALDFAYKIHTDLGKNFIKALDVKSKKAVGKEHLLQNRDVIEIVTSK
ncbi:MAG: redox-regulated ATPase YchF [Nanoarchaeota archaeon]